MKAFPLPFTCTHEVYTSVAEDSYGNPIVVWAPPVEVPCFWWPLDTADVATAPAPNNSVTADVALVIDAGVAVDHRDKFTVDGTRYDVSGLPKDYDHGPWGFTPNRRVVELTLVDP